MASASAATLGMLAPKNVFALAHGDTVSVDISSGVWMEAPDVVSFQFSDPPFQSGNFVQLPDGLNTSPDPSAPGSVVSRVNTGRPGNPTETATVIGPSQMILAFNRLPPVSHVDRIAIRDVTKYSMVGSDGSSIAVTKVYEPYSESIDEGPLGSIRMRFTMQLQLASRPVQGVTYTISHSTAAAPTKVFTYSDKHTRAAGFRTSIVGHRPNDPIKYAYMASRLYGGTNGGSVEFASTYGITTAFLLDSKGNVVKTVTPALRVAWNQTEPSWDFYGTIGIDVADLSRNWVITAMTPGNPTSVTAPGHPFVGGEKVRFRGVNGLVSGGGVSIDICGTNNAGNAPWAAATVSNVVGDTFTVNIDTTGFSAFSTSTFYREDLGGHQNRVYQSFNTNRAACSVWGLDYSDVVTPGLYFWHIPGYGISDPIPISDDAHGVATGVYHAGLYNCRQGTPLNRTSYNRYFALHDGQNGLQTWWSAFPALWSIEKSSGVSYGATFSAGLGAYSTGNGYGSIAGMTWSSGTITVDTGSPHGLPIGHTCVGAILNALPAGYTTNTGSSTNCILTVTDATHFTLPGPATNPGTYTAGTGAWTTGFRTIRAPGGYSPVEDAADVDDVNHDHAGLYLSLAFTFHTLSLAGRVTPFKVDVSSAVCDPVIFAGTDSAPPLFHELVWYAFAYTNLQNLDSSNPALYGSLPGGFGVGHFSQQTQNSPQPIDQYPGTDPNGATPASTTTRIGAFVYASDPISTIMMASFLMRLSMICADYGFTTASDFFKARGILAYNWSNRVWQRTSVPDWQGSQVVAANVWRRNSGNLYLCNGAGTTAASGGPTGTGTSIADGTAHWAYIEAADGGFDQDFYWNSYLDLQNRMGWSRATYLANCCTMGSATSVGNTIGRLDGSGWKLTQAPTFWRATGDFTSYCNMIAPNSNFQFLPGHSGGWDYLFMSADPHYLTATANYINAHWNDGNSPATVSAQTLDPHSSFMTAVGGSVGAGGGLIGSLLNAHLMEVKNNSSPATSDNLKALLANYSFSWGCNPSGRSAPCGFGPRPTVLMDYIDTQYRGIPSPFGIQRFTYAPQGWGLLGTQGLPKNFNEGSGGDGQNNYIADNTAGANEASPTFGSKKVGEPWRFGQSYWEFTPMASTLISTSEFSISSQIQLLSIAMWLNGWDR